MKLTHPVTKVTFLSVILISGCKKIQVDTPEAPQKKTVVQAEAHLTEPPPKNPRCDEFIQRVDGPGGFLSKPKSDSGGTLVILFPQKYTVPFIEVLAERKKGRPEAGRFTGFSNGDRQTWRFSKPGGKGYTGRYQVTDASQLCVWKVKDASKRHD